MTRRTPVMGLPSGPRLITMLLMASGAAVLACSGNADRTNGGESAKGTVVAASDDLNMSMPRASDATLVIHTSPGILEALRAVTDSFAAREAIRVEFAPAPDSTGVGAGLQISSTVDLVVVTGQLAPQLPNDSASWTLPFAEAPSVDPQSAAPTDSAVHADSTRAIRRTTRDRSAKGRRADSIRADSVRRETERMRVDSARADSARLMVLTIPAAAPNSSVAERFVRYLLTDGRATLLRSGVHVLPRLVLRGSGAPLGIRSIVDTVIVTDSVGNAEPQRLR